MDIVRTQEFEEGCGIFDNVYKDYFGLANRIMKTFGTKVYVPVQPINKVTISKETIDEMAKDTVATTIFVTNELIAEGYEVVYVPYKDDKGYAWKIKGLNIYAITEDDAGKTLEGLELSEKEIFKVEEKKKMDTIRKYIMSEQSEKLEMLKRELKDVSENLRITRARLIASIKKYNDVNETYAIALEKSTSAEERVKEIINALEELKTDGKLKSIDFEEEKVVYTTNDISITDEGGHVRPIGKFVVKLNIDTANVNIMNIDNKINVKEWVNRSGGEPMPQHPHVSNNGNPCMGTMAEALSDVCAERDIASAWQIIYSYLSSYNQADVWGKRLKYWATIDGDFPSTRKDGKADYECVNCGCEIDEDRDEYYECDDCGGIVCEDCVRYANNSRYCDSCANKHYNEVDDEYEDIDVEIYTCPNCGKTYSENTRDIYEGESGDTYCCYECAEDAGDLQECDREYEDDWEPDPDRVFEETRERNE